MFEKFREPMYTLALIAMLGTLWSIAYARSIAGRDKGWLPPPQALSYDALRSYEATAREP